MSKVFLNAMGVMFLLGLSACQFWNGYEAIISLPDGATTQQAEELTKAIWEDDFITKISKQFPNFNPTNSEQRITLQWFKFIPFDGTKPMLALQIEIEYKDSLDNAREITQFARSIVEKRVSDYFRAL